MKKIKRIIGVFVLIFLMIISFDTVQAIAPPRLDTTHLGTLDTEQATITVTNVHEKDQLTAYKILDIYKNIVTNEINYRYTDEFYAFLEAGGNSEKDYNYLTEEEYLKLTSGDITSGSTQTSGTLDILVSDYAAYIRKNKLTGIDMITNGTTASLTTNMGSYLILPTNLGFLKLYAVMVGNLEYKEENGEWVKKNSTIVAKSSDLLAKFSIGEIGKQIYSFSIGEEYTCFIEATLPQYPTNAIADLYTIAAFNNNGNTFLGVDNIVIRDGEKTLNLIPEEGEMLFNSSFKNKFVGQEKVSYDWKIINDENDVIGYLTNKINSDAPISFVVSIFPDYIETSNITISYKSKLNDNAKVCRATNSSNANTGVGYIFSYDPDPYFDSTGILMEMHVISAYKIQINNHASADFKEKLGGAVFEIYSDSALTKKVGSVTTDENGFAEFSGLGEGKYYLKEVTAPTGYSLLKLPTEIEIKYDESLVDSETGEYCGPVVDIANQKVSALPITGGMGTIIFTIVGILLIGGAGIGIIYYKKKNKNLV